MRKVSIFTLILISTSAFSQNGKFDFGARGAGMGGASLTVSDPYSLFNNIGGLGRAENHSTFGGYQNRYGIQQFQVVGAGVIYHRPLVNTGLGFYRFGDELFSQQRIHLAIGNQFQMVSIGLGIDLLQYSVSTVGAKQTLAIQFGGIAEITPKFLFGAHIFNLNQGELVEETGENIPTVMKVGFSYRPSEELMLNLEVEKELLFDQVIKTGLEYQIIDQVFLRTGFSTQPFLASFGLGFSPNKFQLDYSFSNNSKLGTIQELSIAYCYKK